MKSTVHIFLTSQMICESKIKKVKGGYEKLWYILTLGVASHILFTFTLKLANLYLGYPDHLTGFSM